MYNLLVGSFTVRKDSQRQKPHCIYSEVLLKVIIKNQTFLKTAKPNIFKYIPGMYEKYGSLHSKFRGYENNFLNNSPIKMFRF